MARKKVGVKVISVDTSNNDLLVTFEVWKQETTDADPVKVSDEVSNFGQITKDELTERLKTFAKSKTDVSDYSAPDCSDMSNKFYTIDSTEDDAANSFGDITA